MVGEGVLLGDDFPEDDTETVDIDLLGDGLAAHDLGGHVKRRSDGMLFLPVVIKVTETEIRHLGVAVLVNLLSIIKTFLSCQFSFLFFFFPLHHQEEGGMERTNQDVLRLEITVEERLWESMKPRNTFFFCQHIRTKEKEKKKKKGTDPLQDSRTRRRRCLRGVFLEREWMTLSKLSLINSCTVVCFFFFSPSFV